MAIPTLLRAEYFDAAIEKASDAAELDLLHDLRRLAVELAERETWVEQRCIENRLAAGEDPRRVRAPSSVSSSSERAAADVHKLELRKCRRAKRPQEIIESMLQLCRNDTQFMKPLLPKIDLPANRELSQQLLVQKEMLQQRFLQFLERSPGAA
jgi:hypothetical protein